MALRLKKGMELQIIVGLGPGGVGFEVKTRAKLPLGTQFVERETSCRTVPNEGAAWVLISQLAQEKLVALAEEAGG